MAGLTKQGLEIKRLNEVRDSLRAEAANIFSDLLQEGEVLDTSSASTIGRLIGLISPTQADLWEALLQVYSAFDPNSAGGIMLDNLVALSGIVRKGASASTARVLLTGNYNVTIPSGSLVSSSFTGNRFEIPSEVVLNPQGAIGVSFKVQTVTDNTDYSVIYSASQTPVTLTYTSGIGSSPSDILQGLADVVNGNYGSVLTAFLEGDSLKILTKDLVSQADYSLSSNLYFTKVTKGTTVRCTETGPIEQETGTIDQISTPIFGWDSIEQFAPATIGSFRETDSQLRERFNQTKYSRGSNILEALYSDLISLDGVQAARIYENLTNTVDSFGLPPHSFMVLVQGGVEQEIAESIWRNRPAGIQTHGNSVYLIKDVLGNFKEVYYQRPTYIDVYVSVTLSTDENFPPDGVERVKSAIFDYINQNAIVGKEVVYSRLYTPINSIPGHQVDSLTLGLSALPTGTTNIAVDFDQIAKIEVGSIEVEIA